MLQIKISAKQHAGIAKMTFVIAFPDSLTKVEYKINCPKRLNRLTAYNQVKGLEDIDDKVSSKIFFQ
ncbi:hypothetical protein HCG49_15555 [Arenibacter sp. 6A1]|uniref:hypothetical protein n=1 Tax=Arenibacter sp. 6A1 TaxID=2720391 RepID=UPI0014471DAF|nr:hypothetical protein [Arenibacter sp. 6A1]NKI27977.1 hypothetical protein [Arenibacter sp. 6A1]